MQQPKNAETDSPLNVELFPENIDHWVHRSNRLRSQVYGYDPSLHYVILSGEGEPLTYKEAMSCELSSKWELAMQEEIKSLYENDIWDLVPPTKGR